MASRSLCRRLILASRRLNSNRISMVSRCLTSISGQTLASDLKVIPQSYSQLRTLCAKSGDGIVINVQNEQDFETRVLNSPVPVVVDFHATWCGPCKLLGPRLELLVAAMEGKVILAKVDVDENFEIAQKYVVTSVPTVLGIRKKEVTDKFIGLQDDDIIETFLEKLIG